MAIGGREGPDREGEYRIFERPRILAFTWLPDRQADATETLVRRDPEEKDRDLPAKSSAPAIGAARKSWPDCELTSKCILKSQGATHRLLRQPSRLSGRVPVRKIAAASGVFTSKFSLAETLGLEPRRPEGPSRFERAAARPYLGLRLRIGAPGGRRSH